ncbi:MAG: 3 beta-hydroxysteroid dehydrogenase/Delta 5--_4-isomerase [bacterium]|nr:3 beta-hydroxysteroid dehydrogenase/Delta 5-->4-isomerase [bacterium]
MAQILVTGASGFVGRHLVEALTADGHTVRALTHRATLPSSLASIPRVSAVKGDLLDPDSLPQALVGIDTVIHLVGIIREFPSKGVTFQRLHTEATANLVAATEAAGIRRYLHMSALGTRPGAVSAYHQTKWLAEERVRGSQLDWTIYRPSLIYGPGDGFTTTMVPLAKGPVFPVIGGGMSQAQPVAIKDVAQAFARGVDAPVTFGQTYDIAGPETFTYRTIYQHITEALGRTFRPLPVPEWAVMPVAMLLQYQPWFPLTVNQLLMLRENNTGDQTTWTRSFGIEPTRLQPGLAFLSPSAAKHHMATT